MIKKICLLLLIVSFLPLIGVPVDAMESRGYDDFDISTETLKLIELQKTN